MRAFCHTCKEVRRATDDDAECPVCDNQLMISGSEVGIYYVADDIWDAFQSKKSEVDILAIDYLKTKYPGAYFIVGKPLREPDKGHWMCRILYDNERVFFRNLFPEFDDEDVLRVIVHKTGDREPFQYRYEIQQVLPKDLTTPEG